MEIRDLILLAAVVFVALLGWLLQRGIARTLGVDESEPAKPRTAHAPTPRPRASRRRRPRIW